MAVKITQICTDEKTKYDSIRFENVIVTIISSGESRIEDTYQFLSRAYF